MNPTALGLALLPTAVLIGAAYWRFKVRLAHTPLTVVAFSFGLALAALVVAVSATYSLRVLSAAQGSNGLVAIPLLVYAASLTAMGRRSKLSVPALVLGGAVGIVPMYFVGFYVWLLAACSFGDCL
ncbi:MAG: hypothetical protein PHS32_07620 [Rhodoferax sp.]|uniref:hypothetical protein n=1 Tax=Rhodoferax sp. TaxID=50421 RepID=UPI002637F387|nr:hypothetical protein [Rhodoferax sp.]MDD5333598.1 hypothetical protein [Rhodoferax sp.]